MNCSYTIGYDIIFKYNILMKEYIIRLYLVRVSKATHAAHDAKHIVVGGIHAHLGRVVAADSIGGKHKLERGVVNAREVARSARLVLLWAQGERVNVNPSVRRPRVVLVRLHQIEVSTFTLAETVLSVELEFGRNYRVLTPAMHVEGRFGKHIGAGVRNARIGHFRDWERHTQGRDSAITKIVIEHARIALCGAPRALIISSWRRCARLRPGRHLPRPVRFPRLPHIIRVGVIPPLIADVQVGICAWILEHTVTAKESVVTVTDPIVIQIYSSRTRESGHCINKGIECVRVVERLGAKGFVKVGVLQERRTVVDIGIWLHNPDKFFAWMIKVEFDLVARGTDRFITSELELFNQIFMRVLRHATAFIGVKEHVIDIKGSSYQRLLVGNGILH